MLLHHMPGAMSYVDLHTTAAGATQRFKKTPLTFGILESDEGWHEHVRGYSVMHAKTTMLSICDNTDVWRINKSM